MAKLESVFNPRNFLTYLVLKIEPKSKSIGTPLDLAELEFVPKQPRSK